MGWMLSILSILWEPEHSKERRRAPGRGVEFLPGLRSEYKETEDNRK